jgi:hypothetical protein
MALCPALWRPEPSVAPKALRFIVIGRPARRSGVRIVRGGRDRLVALGGSRHTESACDESPL